MFQYKANCISVVSHSGSASLPISIKFPPNPFLILAAHFQSLENCSLQNSVFRSRVFQPQAKTLWTRGCGEQAAVSKNPFTGQQLGLESISGDCLVQPPHSEHGHLQWVA